MRFISGFDHYTDLTKIWQAWDSYDIVAFGRTGANAAHSTGAGGIHSLMKIIDAQQTWITGFGLWMTRGSGVAYIVYVQDAANNQVELTCREDGTLRLTCPGGIANSIRVWPQGVWNYVELKVTVANAGGLAEVLVNGEVWATFNGDTQAGANPTADRILWVSYGTGQEYIDDIYINDGNGAVNNNYLGDLAVYNLMPNGVGFYTLWGTLVGAVSHWQAVNEVPDNADASYVADNIPATMDSFTFQDLPPANGIPHAVGWLARARDDAAAANIKRLYRSGIADDLSANKAIPTVYAYVADIMDTDPILLGAWTVANINAAEFGVVVG